MDRWSMEKKFAFIMKAPFISAPLSAIGSILVLITLSRQKSSARPVYHRLMSGMSVMDLLMSLAYSWGHLPAPPDPNIEILYGRPYGRGTRGTCAAQAFFIQLGSMSYGYMLFLSLFFVLSIRYNVSDRIMARYIEPCMHMTVWVFGLVTAICTVALGFANFGATVCWVAPFPTGCEVGLEPCVRGENYLRFAFRVLMVPSWIEASGILICLTIVSWTVFRKARQSARFEAEARYATGNTTIGSKKTPIQRHAQAVMTQCTLYALFFFNAAFWQAYEDWILYFHSPADLLREHYFAFVLSHYFFPLEGFFNFIIFIRTPYLAVRLREPELSRSKALLRAIWSPDAKPPPQPTIGHRNAFTTPIASSNHSPLDDEA